MSSLLSSLRRGTSVAMVSSRKKFGVQVATCSVPRFRGVNWLPHRLHR